MSDTTVVPPHIGFIVDGNRRWAAANGKPIREGHRLGMEVLRDVSLAAFDRGVQCISAYIFSTENWQRTQEEISHLMGLVIKVVTEYLHAFDDKDIRVVMLGTRRGLDKKVLRAIDKAVETTKDNTRGILALCFNYGGQQEVADAAQALVDQNEQIITPEKIAQNLYAPEVPPVDLIIRTSGEQRLSGFMLWRSDYAELYFSNILWPDFTATDLDAAIAEYTARQRRFGK